MKNREEESIKVENQEVKSMQVENRIGAERKKMCVFHIVGYGILAIAVAVLFVLHFSQPKSKALPAHSAGGSQIVIVTINTDSVTEHFEYMKLLKSDLEQEMAKYEAELKPKYASFEEKYRNYMINVQNNVLTQTQMQNAEKQLMEEKNRLDELSAKYTEIMSKKEMSVQNEIMDSLRNASKRVNEASYNADYIFAISTGSAILYSNEVYDITQEVIKELNESYKKSTK
jgi:outer membrane protein